jgi:molybdate transport system permease protein
MMVHSKSKWKWLIDGILTLPLVLPPTVIGLLLLIVFGKNGFIGNFLSNFNIRVVFSITGAIIAATVVAYPLMYRTTKGAFEQIDMNLVYAARTLGLSEHKIFWKIIIPLSLPNIRAGTILAFSRALGEFGATIVIAGNIPNKTQTISLLIYTAIAGGDMELAVRWVGIIIVISLLSVLSINMATPTKSGVGRSI